LERKFNWLGWLFTVLYVSIMIILICFGMHMEKMDYINYRNYFYSAATLAFVISFAVIPHIFYLTLGILLPIKQERAFVIFKNTKVGRIVQEGGATTTTVKQFITFELPDGSRKVFKVSRHQYYTILETEQGLLTYKEQRRNTYFIDFQRQK